MDRIKRAALASPESKIAALLGALLFAAGALAVVVRW
jgi:hypothetical protein